MILHVHATFLRCSTNDYYCGLIDWV